MKMLKRLFILLIIAGLCYGLYFLFVESPVFKVNTLNYNPDASLDVYELQRYSGIHYGDSIFTVNTEAAVKTLEAHPYVKTATIEKHYPGTIDIAVTYRTHYLNIKYSDIILSLDETLQVLKVMDEEADGYTVVGMPFNAFATGKTIEVDAFYVLENIVQLIDLLNQSTVDASRTITYEDNSIVIECDGIKIDFGDGENIEGRFNKFINIYQSLQSEGIHNGMIDVSSDGLPVYRPFGE